MVINKLILNLYWKQTNVLTFCISLQNWVSDFSFEQVLSWIEIECFHSVSLYSKQQAILTYEAASERNFPIKSSLANMRQKNIVNSIRNNIVSYDFFPDLLYLFITRHFFQKCTN